MFSTLNQKRKPVLIRAVFDADDELATNLAKETELPGAVIRTVEVAKRLDGELEVTFPEASPARTIARARVESTLL